MNFRKLIRLVLKIPLTPFVIVYYLAMILMSYITLAVDWLYESEQWEIDFTKKLTKDFINEFKNWFTTI